MPDGKLKICNAACDEQFYFEHNVFKKGLYYSWKYCGKNIKAFRKEKNKKTMDCRKCSNKQKCSQNDCRVMAWVYTGNAKRSNPLVCYMVNKL